MFVCAAGSKSGVKCARGLRIRDLSFADDTDEVVGTLAAGGALVLTYLQGSVTREAIYQIDIILIISIPGDISRGISLNKESIFVEIEIDGSKRVCHVCRSLSY